MMNDSIAMMKLVHFGIPTQINDINGLTLAISARNLLFCADLIGRTAADQWEVFTRVRAIVLYDNADQPPSPTSHST